jgi:uncharacterized protein YjbJ (UPF0337 family)
MSTTLDIKNWKETKEKLKEANTNLTDEDLEYEEGNEDALLERLSAKMGRTKEEVKGWVESVAFTKVKAS